MILIAKQSHMSIDQVYIKQEQEPQTRSLSLLGLHIWYLVWSQLRSLISSQLWSLIQCLWLPLRPMRWSQLRSLLRCLLWSLLWSRLQSMLRSRTTAGLLSFWRKWQRLWNRLTVSTSVIIYPRPLFAVVHGHMICWKERGQNLPISEGPFCGNGHHKSNTCYCCIRSCGYCVDVGDDCRYQNFGTKTLSECLCIQPEVV